MTDQATPAKVRLTDGLGPTLRRLRMYLLAYLSAPPLLVGYIAGLIWHRMHDGWGVARVQLDRLDDAMIDDMEKHKRSPGA